MPPAARNFGRTSQGADCPSKLALIELCAELGIVPGDNPETMQLHIGQSCLSDRARADKAERDFDSRMQNYRQVVALAATESARVRVLERWLLLSAIVGALAVAGLAAVGFFCLLRHVV